MTGTMQLCVQMTGM